MNLTHLLTAPLLLAVAASTISVSASTPDAARQSAAGAMPQRWVYESPYAAAGDSVSAMWWRALGDPLLDTLIARGRENNYDIAAATSRIAAARAQVGIAQAGYYPSVGISAG